MDIDLTDVKTPVEEKIERTLDQNPQMSTPAVLGYHLLDPNEHYETVEELRQ